MVKLLIIADDFTGALDTGVQFAARGASTAVVTDPAYDFAGARPDLQVQVLVLDAETRHLTAEEAYAVVHQAVRRALDAGVAYIYKKTDSALRGNIGSELAAALDAAGGGRLPFIPAFPKMRRITREGVHYIDGVPVAESVFGQDPFEPVRHSQVAGILREQSQVPVALCRRGEAAAGAGIQVYDAETDADLERIARELTAAGQRLFAGCAGFASPLADQLALRGQAPAMPPLVPALFVVCGSVNPVTKRQLAAGERAGFLRFRLSPEQKLEPKWLEQDDCERQLQTWLARAEDHRFCILDANDPDGSQEAQEYAARKGMTKEQLRVRISSTLGALMKRLLDGGLDATLMCTGGDTLLAMMGAVGITQLEPVCEMAPGAVLAGFGYRGRTYHIISKSGGFGEPQLLCDLASLVGGGYQKEDVSCL